MNTNTEISICLTLGPDLIPRFYQFLGQGFRLKVRVGCSIKELLCKQLGISEDYLENRIQTLFLDGKPVDNVNTAIIREKASLALSAAMPGLVGATLRKGGSFTPMRSQISHRTGMESFSGKKGMVVLKLFNLIAEELGPIFLKQGIWIHVKDFQEFLSRQPDNFFSGLMEVRVDEDKIDLHKLSEIKSEDREIFLKLKCC